MLRILRKNRFENLTAPTLIGECLVCFGSTNGERQRMEDCRFSVTGIFCVHSRHLLFEGVGVRGVVLPVLAVYFSQSVYIAHLAGSGLRIIASDRLCPVQSIASGCHVAVAPQTVVMRHRDAPLHHGTFRILTGKFSKGLPTLLVLERMQQRHRSVETSARSLRA